MRRSLNQWFHDRGDPQFVQCLAINVVFIGNVGRGPLLAMIRRILVCLDKSTYTDAALTTLAGWPGITTRRWKVW